MATSAISPRFLPQTAVFTGQFLPFAVFAIAMTLVASAVVRLNIGRIICFFNLRTQKSPTGLSRDWGSCRSLPWLRADLPLTWETWAVPHWA